MNKGVEDMNRLLELMGSDMRVQAGDVVMYSFAEIVRLLPGYIDQKIQEALTK